MLGKARTYSLKPASLILAAKVHITPELREQAKAFGVPVMEYDGIAEVWVDSLEDWKEVVSDPAFVKEVGGESN